MYGAGSLATENRQDFRCCQLPAIWHTRASRLFDHPSGNTSKKPDETEAAIVYVLVFFAPNLTSSGNSGLNMNGVRPELPGPLPYPPGFV